MQIYKSSKFTFLFYESCFMNQGAIETSTNLGYRFPIYLAIMCLSTQTSFHVVPKYTQSPLYPLALNHFLPRAIVFAKLRVGD